MAVITGTALSKNTPVRILQELECAERRETGQDERIHVARPIEKQDEQIELQTHVQTDSVSVASE